MHRIVRYEKLAERIFLAEVEAPNVARACQPGEFVIVRAEEKGERLPFTICDFDREKGTVTLVVQIVGAGSEKMSRLHEGDSYCDVVGPLGNPSDFVKEDLEEVKKRCYLFVGGGLGTAPVYPQAKWMHEHGIECDVIIGAKNRDLLILTEQMGAVSNLHIATDDGSYGYHGMVTGLMEDLVQNQGKKFDVCVAIGPMIMMKFASLTAQKLGMKSIVSMNPIMVDGTGMCGACRLTVNGEVKFACVDGPEFDGAGINWNEAMERQLLYKTQEGRAMLKLKEGDTHHGGCGQCGGDQ